MVHEHDGQWRRVAHDFLGRPDAGVLRPSLTSFEDVESRPGLRALQRPAVILCERKSPWS